ncbi:MAG: 4-(cytidine 5'-diphospho)-2-C-methyl-D-erythritol kinase [Flavobacteriales bacterium]|nr:4-(cytidine 5'-diphospho)-2-C-methyl-D-erythritol kinase [Flavobacteriales bacterium]|tara:strand:- start:648 stop:1391 length:744 start_codon:yes stop_codon:yes gene_type:complete
MILYSNAKINLGLNILNKRIDGLHNISSVFYPTDFYSDIIELNVSNKFNFTSSGIMIPGNNNTCIKAWDLMKKIYNIPNVNIHLHKRIPIGGGLGGGSSNAAFILKSLNDLFSLDISNDELKRYALSIGADCPFFIENIPKYVSGIGDKMEDVSLDLENYKIRLFDPGIHVSTKEAYAVISPSLPDSNIVDIIKKPIDKWRDLLVNDFELIIFKRYPDLEKFKEKIYLMGAKYVSMSGSGSVFFGIF